MFDGTLPREFKQLVTGDIIITFSVISEFPKATGWDGGAGVGSWQPSPPGRLPHPQAQRGALGS